MEKHSDTDFINSPGSEYFTKVFKRNTLEEIQRRIADVTELAFVTVNSEGIPLTSNTAFSEYCRRLQMNPCAEQYCSASNAFGCAMATKVGEKYIYFCPCGLLEVAIPIIVNGHLLGGIMGGQVRCDDAPSDTVKLQEQMPQNKSYLVNPEFMELYDKNVTMSYSQFEGIASLVSMIVTQYVEKEILAVTYKNERYALDQQATTLIQSLDSHDYRHMLKILPEIVDEVISSDHDDSKNLRNRFFHIGELILRSLEPEKNLLAENEDILKHNVLYADRKVSWFFWMYDLMDYAFQKKAESRNDAFRFICGYIDENICEDINLGSLTESCHISQSYLSRLFQQMFSVSVMEYIHLKKINKAKVYFAQTDQTVGDVAFKFGYNESGYFCKVFKKYEHMTVLEYKDMVRRNSFNKDSVDKKVV
ncbi:MAG: PocR ligand-binding domain-containing protein [Clostridiales Family XIII bacterium]|jgi:two-component system response regulator YesN|nr:PocR ligand-binding domain-containing protein [Clostridiales Family XIII bacterium]